MPILTVELVVADREQLRTDLARRLADAAGRLFGSAPGETWVRVHTLSAADYAENDIDDPEGWGSVFVTVLKGRRPSGEALKEEVRTLTETVARVTGRPPDRVHVLYEPDASGRIAFGGVLKE